MKGMEQGLSRFATTCTTLSGLIFMSMAAANEPLTQSDVIQFGHATPASAAFFRPPRLDLSEWVSGTVEFDLLVAAEPAVEPSAENWILKLNCAHPCSIGNVPLSESVEGVAPVIGVWQHYTFQVADLVARGLELDRITAPPLVLPVPGNQNGALLSR